MLTVKQFNHTIPSRQTIHGLGYLLFNIAIKIIKFLNFNNYFNIVKTMMTFPKWCTGRILGLDAQDNFTDYVYNNKL